MQCSCEMWIQCWLFLDEVCNRQLLKNSGTRSQFYLLTRFIRQVFSSKKIWTCFYKLFWKTILSVLIGYVPFTSDTSASDMSENVLYKLWLTQHKRVCLISLCPCCLLLVALRKWKYLLNFYEHCAECHSVLFYFFCFVPHTLPESLRRERRLVVTLETMNRVRRNDRETKWSRLSICSARRFLTAWKDLIML